MPLTEVKPLLPQSKKRKPFSTNKIYLYLYLFPILLYNNIVNNSNNNYNANLILHFISFLSALPMQSYISHIHSGKLFFFFILSSCVIFWTNMLYKNVMDFFLFPVHFFRITTKQNEYFLSCSWHEYFVGDLPPQLLLIHFWPLWPWPVTCDRDRWPVTCDLWPVTVTVTCDLWPWPMLSIITVVMYYTVLYCTVLYCTGPYIAIHSHDVSMSIITAIIL